MVCDASKSLKSQVNALFYRNVWAGPYNTTIKKHSVIKAQTVFHLGAV